MSVSDFPARLRALAEYLKIEHQALAYAGGVSKVTLSNYIHGQKFPRMETIANWISHYGINANWLILGLGPMFLDGETIQAASPASSDPVIIRMEAAVKLLRQANAADEVIQKAILAALNSCEANPS